jgi:hypothetical protein
MPDDLEDKNRKVTNWRKPPGFPFGKNPEGYEQGETAWFPPVTPYPGALKTVDGSSAGRRVTEGNLGFPPVRDLL